MSENQSGGQLTKLQKAENLLPEDERRLYEEFKESGKPGLAPSLSASFFELYVNGNTVRDIHSLNKVYDIGAIIDAKVRHGWDEQKDKYISELFNKARTRLLQVQMESADFIADLMTATHKKHGQAIKRYLQTGDESALQGFDLGSITQYNKGIEGLLKITGQDKKKEVTINSNVDSGVKDITQIPLTESQAARILEVMSGDDDGDS